MNLSVFGKYGVQLLAPEGIDTPVCELAHNGNGYVLDEIGGIELLNPAFASALEVILSSGIPILGVVKSEGSAGALIDKLGSTEEYELAAVKLRDQLRNDPDTLVYECTQHDENALLLARQWAEAFVHE